MHVQLCATWQEAWLAGSLSQSNKPQRHNHAFAVMHDLAGSLASWHCSNLDWLYSNAHLTQMADTHVDMIVKVCVSTWQWPLTSTYNMQRSFGTRCTVFGMCVSIALVLDVCTGS